MTIHVSVRYFHRRSIYTRVNVATNARAGGGGPPTFKILGQPSRGGSDAGVCFRYVGMREMRQHGYFPRYKAGL